MQTTTGGAARSVWSLAAATYGARPDDESTLPTGFDPHLVGLFEAMLGAAILVAHADGHFDDVERRALEQVIHSLGSGSLPRGQVTTLVEDFEADLARDGFERRVELVIDAIVRPDFGRELLRVATVVALASHDVSREERALLDRFAHGMGMDVGEVDAVIAEARDACVPR
jgi:tellurite resistance protein